MAQVKIFNRDHREYKENFEDEMITIPAGGFVEMGRARAVVFLSSGCPMLKDGQGRPLHPKKLEMVEDPEAHAAHRDQPLKFTAPDGEQFRTQSGYDAHLKKLEGDPDEKRSEPRRRRRLPNATSLDKTDRSVVTGP